MMKGLTANEGSSIFGAPMVGNGPLSSQNQKYENRLHKVEQSNRALLEELMRIQNEIKITSKREQQRLEEHMKEQQKYEQSFRVLQTKLAENEERSNRLEKLNQEMGFTIKQLQLASTQQSSRQGRDDKDNWKKEIDNVNTNRENLEKVLFTMKNDFADVRGEVQKNDIKINQLLLANSDGKRNNEITKTSNEEVTLRLKTLQEKILELQSNLKAEVKARESLENKIKDVENVLSKNKGELQSKKAEEMDKVNQEFHQVLAVEIDTRRDQFNLLTSQIQECNANIRASVLALHKEIDSQPNNNNANWKLDAIKVQQISQEASDSVRKPLENEIQLMKQEQKNIMKILQQNKDKLKKESITNENDDPRVDSQNTSHNLNIMGNEIEQRIDYLSFGQEKLKKQINEMHLDLQRSTELKEGSSYDEQLMALDRKVVARIDGEVRERIIEGKNLKNEIELLKKNSGVATNQAVVVNKDHQAQLTDDYKLLKAEIDKSKVDFRKMAESVQVIKTTLGDKLDDEVKIRKEETKKLEENITTIKTWIKSNSTL